MYPYLQFRDKYTEATRIPRGFKEALEAIEDAWQALPVSVLNFVFNERHDQCLDCLFNLLLCMISVNKISMDISISKQTTCFSRETLLFKSKK